MMPPYLATNIEASIASFIGSSVISQGKVMVGKPSGRNFLFSAALRIIIWSSSAWREVLEPESMTIFFRPACVNFSVNSTTSSRPEPFTATGQEFALASSATLSALSLVAA